MNVSSTGASAAESYTAALPAAASAIGHAAASPVARGMPAQGGAAQNDAMQSGAAAAQKDPAAIDAAIKAANEAAKRAGTNVEFAKDNDSGRVVIRIIDSETQKVLRQFPSEEMLELGKSLDGMRGTMIQLKA